MTKLWISAALLLACLLAVDADNDIGEGLNLDEDAVSVDRLFYTNDFPGVCQTGTRQSPINVPSDTDELDDAFRPQLTFPTAVNPSVINTGVFFQVLWDKLEGQLPKLVAGGGGLSDILLDPDLSPDVTVEVEPVEFHVHFPAEHIIQGQLFAGELHIVSLVAPGSAPAEWGCDEFWEDPENNTPNFDNCVAVFGILYKIGDTTPEYLMDFLESAPSTPFDSVPLHGDRLSLQSILPNSKSHYTYFGSLTTPSCAEGLRWHVFEEAIPITTDALELAQTKLARTVIGDGDDDLLGFRANNRFTQPLNGRQVFFVEGDEEHKARERKYGSDGEPMNGGEY